MKRVYNEYTEWEDYKKGMYETTNLDLSLEKKAASLLKNADKLRKIAIKVLERWPIATLENLTNDSCNKIAWLGQASCCYEYGTPEILTKKAWATLNEFEQFRANKAVRLVIESWTAKYNKTESSQLSMYADKG